MPSVDERIVSAAFENAKFEAAVAVTMATLVKLDTAMQQIGRSNSFADIEKAAARVTLDAPMSALDKLKARLSGASQGAAEGLGGIEQAGNRVTLDAPISALDKLQQKLGGIGSGSAAGFASIETASNGVTLQGISTAVASASAKFSILEGAAAVALGNVAAKALETGTAVGKSLTLDPVMAGFHNYETQINAVQTIMANTGLVGQQGLGTVSKSLNELNTYANQTVYNFSEMAKNIGTFTAAGVSLGTATESIKGIANLAALSGSSSQQASTAMYQLSQAIAAGKVNLQDWNSVVNAGMGGKVFQKALFNTAKAMGTITSSPVGQTFEEWQKAGNSFRQSLSATQQAARNTSNVLKQAKKDADEAVASARSAAADANSAAAKRVSDAQSSAADAIESATQRVKDTQESAAASTANAARRIKDVQESSAESAASAAEKVVQAQEDGAQATENAAKRVKDAETAAAQATAQAADKVVAAHKNVSDTARQSADDLKEAQDAQTQTFLQAASDVRAALDTVTEARRRLDDALKPPSADEQQAALDRVTGAQLDQRDLATAITDAQTEQKRSTEDLAAAQRHLSDVQSSGGSADDVRAASRAVEDAQRRAADDADAVQRATLRQNAATRDLHDAERNLQDVQAKGSDQDQRVIDARTALADATDRYRAAQLQQYAENLAAEKKVNEARAKGVADQKAAGRELADAEKAQAKIIIDSRKSVADAEKEQTKVILDARRKIADAEADQVRTLTKNREAIANAQRDQAKAITDSQRSIADAEKNQAKVIVDSRQSVVDAEKDQAKTITDSRKRIIDAEKAAAEKIRAARDSISGGNAKAPSWLTSDVLTNTLKQFTGDLSAAQLKAQGFNDAQIKAIQGQAKVAVGAATNIKTFTQLMEALKEEVASAWSTIFKTLFGDIFSATKLFSGFHVAAENALTGPIYAFNRVLQGWARLGGRETLIEGLKNAFQALGDVIDPVKRAFRDIFPPATAESLLSITKTFESFTERLRPSAETVDNLQRTFRGFFAVLHIGWTIIKGVVGVIGDLLGVASHGGGGFLSFTAAIGDFLTGLDAALTKGGLLTTFFRGLGVVLAAPMRLISALARLFFGLFGGVDTTKATAMGDSLDKVGKAAGPLTPILESLKRAWDGFVHILSDAKDLVSPWLDKIGSALSGIGTTIANALSGDNFSKTLAVVQTGLIGGIFLALRKGIEGNSAGLLGSLKTSIGGLGDVFRALTGNLEAMQQNIKANTILQIAAAIGVLAAGVFVLSTIDPKRLASALTAMAVGMGELMGAVKLMTSGLGMTSILTLPVLAAGLVGVATATVILAGAVKLFSTMSWEDIAKGLVGVGGGLAAIGIGLKFLSGPTLLVQGPALIAIGLAMNLLALAVKQFASIKWEDLARGLAGMLGALIAIAVPLEAMGPELVLVGPGLIAAAFGISMLAGAVAAFGSLKPDTLIKGILGIAGALVAIGLAINLIPPTVALQAAGLVILSIALAGIAEAIKIMGNLSVGEIVKGLVTMGGALAILAVGLSAMSGTLPGSVALLAAAGALAILAPTLGFLGTLNWGTILKGLAAMALTLGTLSLVGTVASSGLVSLGIAMLPLAGVFVLTAGAVFIFAKALALLGDSGGKGIAVMVTAITAFIALLPTLLIQFVSGLVGVVQEVADIAPKVVVALGTILDTIIAFIIQNAAKMAVAFGALVDAGVAILVQNAPKLIQAGIDLLNDLLSGIDQNLSTVVPHVISIITQFLQTMAAQAPNLVASGAAVLVAFMNGIAAQVPRLVAAAVGMLVSFETAIAGQLPKLLLLGASMVTNLIAGLLGQVARLVSAGLSMVLSIITGIGNALPRIVAAAGNVIIKFVNALADVGPKLVDAGFKALINFLHGVAQAIRDNNPALVDAGVDIAKAIAEGLVEGLSGIGSRLIRPAIEKLFDALPGWAKRILGIHSPSRVFMEIGKFSAQGVVVGLQNGTSDVASAAEGIGDAAISGIQKSMAQANKMVDIGLNTNPTITPVLDLTNVKDGIRQINGIGGSTSISAGSFGMASAISAETQATLADQAASASGSSAPLIKFEQTNTSPAALSAIDIYRQTNNQLSQVKGALEFALADIPK